MTTPVKPFQYQSFPDAPGMVDSDAKLAAMNLPSLTGLSFLDVACNEGYYCGVALRDGAKRVVGLDSSPGFISAARQRFPAADFLCQTWDQLPAEHFDTVLFASAMHYLSTEKAILEMLVRLRNALKPEGLLVLEVGVAPGKEDEILEITRAEGSKVFYPTESLLLMLLRRAGLIERFQSISQPGDGIERHVYHCRKRQATVLILDAPYNSGKTRFAWALTGHQHERVLSVDVLAQRTFKSHFPSEVFDERTFAGIDYFFLKSPTDAAVVLGLALANSIIELAKLEEAKGWTQATIVVDGLDLSRDDHFSVYDRARDVLGSECLIWIARRDTNFESKA
ncbi:MAG TPA: methyltransferase domain-containing protein [Xanthobacteraceae bacterium]|nr:methyltransferase domain-containing protein [Xanthobacteraceae bacterium]